MMGDPVDGSQFDAFAKALTGTDSRRGVVSGILGGIARLVGAIVLGAPLALGGTLAGDAKHKKHKKKHHGGPVPVSPPPAASCTPEERLCDGACVPATHCCAD